jgi:hypothetical protein
MPVDLALWYRLLSNKYKNFIKVEISIADYPACPSFLPSSLLP